MRLFEGTPFDIPPRCDRCGELEDACQCEPEPPPRTPPSEQTARLSIEKRKKGKSVTLIKGLLDEDTALADLLTKLKTICGAGGSMKEGNLEIQGRHLDSVRGALKDLGFRVKG